MYTVKILDQILLYQIKPGHWNNKINVIFWNVKIIHCDFDISKYYISDFDISKYYIIWYNKIWSRIFTVYHPSFYAIGIRNISI